MARARRTRAKDNGNESSRRFWAFCCNPREYRILDAVNKLKIDWWQTKGSRIQIGDHVLIWQTRDTQGRRGIVALAEVVQGPEVRSDEGNPYHRIHDKSSINAERVGVSYIPLKNYLWSGRSLDEDEFLSSLSVAKARGGTVFHVTPHEWSRVVLAAGRQNLSEAADIDADIDEVRQRRDLPPTQKEALIQARRGQGRFRQDLFAHWGGCAVIGCTVESVLRASHIKPWRQSSDAERLDPANGLLLIANLDALFNDGLITFDNEGRMLVSARLSQKEQSLLHLRGRLRKKLTVQQRHYLKFHRENEFE
jgi:hypothetical protein